MSYPLGEMRGWRHSVEEDGVGVPVGYLRHVFEYVFFRDDSQQPPNDKQREKKGEQVRAHIILCHGKSKTESRRTHTEQRLSLLSGYCGYILCCSGPRGKWLAALFCLSSLSKALVTAFQLTRGKKRNPDEACFGAALQRLQ